MPAPKVYNKHHKNAPADARYIGRGSPYGNRFIIGEHGDRDEVCDLFEQEQLPNMDVRELANCDLVCFCAPHRCHGDSILLKANHRVLVFGGRKFDNRKALYRSLDVAHMLRKITCIIEGEASGADRMAREWAEEHGVPVDRYPAKWDDIDRPGARVRKNKFGKLYDADAGPLRNTIMLREGRPDKAIGFPGGSGTANMAKQCIEYGLTPIFPKVW
ncbi:hypothetical protein [Bradyrhizobium phage BDU-MI-1]|nr:hypothetical protein [Bradyrhizobium phage BDU-MI-1]